MVLRFDSCRSRIIPIMIFGSAGFCLNHTGSLLFMAVFILNKPKLTNSAQHFSKPALETYLFWDIKCIVSPVTSLAASQKASDKVGWL